MITQRFGGALALAVLGLSLAGGGVALAATTDAPIAGTTACTNLVNTNPDVVFVQSTVDSAQNTLNTAIRTNAADSVITADRAALGRAQSQLATVTANVTASLCTGTSTTPAPTTDPTPAPVTPRARPVQTVEQIDARIDALSCTSSNSDVLAIDRAIANRQVQHLTASEPSSRLAAKVDSLDCTTGALTPAAAAQSAKACGCVLPTTVVPPVTEAPVTEAPVVTQAPVTLSPAASYSAVVPTQDDNSVATTSGSQVTDVPFGSAQTGAV